MQTPTLPGGRVERADVLAAAAVEEQALVHHPDELAVLAEVGPVGPEDHAGVPQRRADRRVALGEAHHERDGVRAGDAAERLGVGPRHDLRVLDVGAVVAQDVVPRRVALARVRERIADVARVAGHEQLGEHDERRPLARGLGGELLDPCEARRGIHVGRLELDDRDAWHRCSCGFVQAGRGRLSMKASSAATNAAGSSIGAQCALPSRIASCPSGAVSAMYSARLTG